MDTKNRFGINLIWTDCRVEAVLPVLRIDASALKQAQISLFFFQSPALYISNGALLRTGVGSDTSRAEDEIAVSE